MKRAHRADPEVAAQRELVAGPQADRLDLEREPLEPRQRGERVRADQSTISAGMMTRGGRVLPDSARMPSSAGSAPT